MPTNRKVISDIEVSMRALNPDDRISRRYILSKLLNKAQKFIRQDLDARRLFRITNLWKKIDSIPLCEEDLVKSSCVDVCNTVMKSKYKLPKSFTSNYGTLVKVFTLNGREELKQTDIPKYKDIVNREFVDKNKHYFWIDNGYIYIPDAYIEEVMVLGLFFNVAEVNKLNEQCGGKPNCDSPLDDEFPCPDYLLDIVMTEFQNEIAGQYKRMPVDEKVDLDTNIKN